MSGSHGEAKMNRLRIAALAAALCAASVAFAQHAFEGNEYEGALIRVAGEDSPICPPTGTLRYRVQVRRADMVVRIQRQGETQWNTDTTPINPDGSFGRTRQFGDGATSTSTGRIEAERVVWDIKVQRGAASCVLRAELARVGGQAGK
jgi:hypothetical protein